MQMTADKCNRCGKVVVKYHHADSSDMVKTQDSFFYMCDVGKEESSRPALQLREYGGQDESRMYCLDCLLETVGEWVGEMKKRGPSAIPQDHIIFPKGKVPSTPVIPHYPVCGK